MAVNLQVLRTLDKADRMDPPAVFDLLTDGRKDKSGDFTAGCGIDNAQAVFLTGFVFSQRLPQIMGRLELIERLDSQVVDIETGRTALDNLLDQFIEQKLSSQEITYALDDMIIACRGTSAKGEKDGA